MTATVARVEVYLTDTNGVRARIIDRLVDTATGVEISEDTECKDFAGYSLLQKQDVHVWIKVEPPKEG